MADNEIDSAVVTFVRPTDPPPEDLPQTFIDRYASWVSTVTDAPVQYHRAMGVSILSTVMTPFLTFPTAYGNFVPNVWVMILAGTTMTRKSTSLDIARRLLDDVTDDYLLATDGSPEGLFTEMGYRDGKVSVFHRDEITGFMSAIAGRDYLAGLLESFTRLYDGQPETRVLRRERIEVKHPYLVFMAGGIKSRMEELVGMEHIRNGFIPRFILVSGSTTRDQIRPIGPPEEPNTDGELPRDIVLNELWSINQHYQTNDEGEAKAVVKIAGIPKVQAPAKRNVRLRATPGFWNRLRDLQDDAIRLGEHSSEPELYTPLYQRLANSVLKVAMLVCGADFREEMTEIDLQKAIALSQEWIETSTEFATAIEQRPQMDKWEKLADRIVKYVRAQAPEPVTQTTILQKFRIRKRDIPDIEATLQARGMVEITPWPHPTNLSGTKIYYRPGIWAQQATHPRSLADREQTYRAEKEGHQATVVSIRGRPINGYRIETADTYPALDSDNVEVEENVCED